MGRSKYRKGGQYIVTIFWPRGQNIVGVKISSHTGTNNIPRCDVPTIIRRAGEMIDDLHEMRPNARLQIPAIPRRYDDPDHRDICRDKINKVNSFLEHKCKKNPNCHFLKHNFCFEDYKADGMHFKPIGVDKYASNIKAMINSMNIYGK